MSLPTVNVPSIGFTGTRKGMSEPQKGLLEHYRPNVLYHGDAVGADAEADALAKELGIPRVAIPGVTASGAYKDRAYCDAEAVIDNGLLFLSRNRLIVRMCDLLIAAPAERSMARRSGTWATVRYARKEGKTTWIALPNGDLEVKYDM